MRLILQRILPWANVHKKILPAVRLVISVAAMVYVVYLLYHLPMKWPDMSGELLLLSVKSVTGLLLTLLLMPLNWGVEVVKWRFLALKLQPLSWSSATRGVLTGISLGMITPKRTGEFAGRVQVLEPGNRMKGVMLNMAGSLSQLLITLLVGCIALLHYTGLTELSGQFLHGNYFRWSLIPAMLGISIIAVTLLLLPRVSRILFRRYPHNSLSRTIQAFSLLSVSDMAVLTMLSMGRYMVFMSQYYILIVTVGLNIDFLPALKIIAIVYLIMTLIPLSAIWELGVRGSVAVLVFGTFMSSPHDAFYEARILAASTLLWIVNLALPALVGGLTGLNHALVHYQYRRDE